MTTRQRPLPPRETASRILLEGKGDRRAVEAFAWKQLERCRQEEGDDSEVSRYWLEVAGAIADRLETPPIPDAERPKPPW